MTPHEALRDLESRKLVEQHAFKQKSFPKTMRLLPGLSEAEIDRFGAKLPSPIPAEVRELLRVTRGIEDILYGIDFAYEEGCVECFETMPNFLPLTGDGTGNYWGVDLMPDSLEWGPIYFWCHDAPVVIYQCANLTEFVLAIAEYHTPDRPSIFRDYEEQMWKVWRENPGLIAQPDAARSSEPDLRSFAEGLGSDWLLCDLRNPNPGDGFSWGRHGVDTEHRRAGNLPLFAYRKPEKKPGLFKRLFGR